MKKLMFLLALTATLTACGNHSRRDEIEARKSALKQKQDSALAAAQQQLAEVDSMLIEASRRHDEQHQWAMTHATQLSDSSPEVQQLNRMRARRDSLQAQWQVLGAKIRYIRQLKAKSQDGTKDSTKIE